MECSNGSQEDISEWLDRKNIFITGGAGFIGKILVEKLLRTSKNIGKIYLLMRPKRKISIESRLEKIFQSELMKQLREKDENIFKKIIGIQGDILKNNLNLCEELLREMQSEISIIFHIAASVRFDDGIKKAILTNVKGTHNVVKFAETCNHLEVFQHVSTSYCNINQKEIDEFVYPSKIEWKNAIELAENLDESILHALTSKITGEYPNTYTFTKQIAENLVQDYAETLPCVIVRPSIVSTYNEPVKGWIDNYNGPIGLLMASGKGVLRTLYASEESYLDLVSADKIIKGMIVTAWDKAKNKSNRECPVYHLTRNLPGLDLLNLMTICYYVNSLSPMQYALRPPNTYVEKNYYFYHIQVFFWHILPALFIDSLVKLSGKKPILMPIVRQLYVANEKLYYFLKRSWIFKENRLKNIENNLVSKDFENFNCCYNLPIYNFVYFGYIGCRKYLAKDFSNKEQEIKNKYKYNWMIVFNISFHFLILIFLWYIFKNVFLNNL